MKRFALATSALLTLAVAAPAFASDQLAASLGVADQGFSVSELTELKAAYDDGNATRVNFILENGGAGNVIASTKNVGLGAPDQLANTLGIDAADYTVAELAQLKAALDEDDAARISAILSHAAQTSDDTPEARVQLGLSVGLDAMTNSRAALVHEHES